MSHFHHTRVYPFSPDAVFAAFSDPERLARWWGPEGFTNTFSVFSFTPGGEWIFTMHGPDGRAYANTHRFEEIVPGRRLRTRHLSLPNYELVVELQPEGASTRLVWTADFANEQFGEKMRRFLETCNEQNLTRLGQEMARASSSRSRE